MKCEPPADWQSRNCDFAARRSSTTSGRLVFASDAAGVTILADPSLPELARGSFAHHPPRVWVDQGTITFQYRSFPCLSRLVPSQRSLGEVKLNPSIPWAIEFRGSITNIHADLRGLELPSLDVLGGASQIRLLLSRPVKTAFLYITGGIREGTIHVPPRVGMRVQLSGGASNLVFDGQRFAAINGDTNLENSGFKNATSRCEICIAGGASNLTIEEAVAIGGVEE